MKKLHPPPLPLIFLLQGTSASLLRHRKHDQNIVKNSTYPDLCAAVIWCAWFSGLTFPIQNCWALKLSQPQEGLKAPCLDRLQSLLGFPVPNFPENLTYLVLSWSPSAHQQGQVTHKKQLEAFFFIFWSYVSYLSQGTSACVPDLCLVHH